MKRGMAENSGRYYLEMEWPKGDKKSEKKKKQNKKKKERKKEKRQRKDQTPQEQM